MNYFQSKMPYTYYQAQQYALPPGNGITTNEPFTQNESHEAEKKEQVSRNDNLYKPKASHPLIFTPPNVPDRQIKYKQIMDYEESEDYLSDETEDEINSSELEKQFLMQLSEQEGSQTKEIVEFNPFPGEDNKEKYSSEDGIVEEESSDHHHYSDTTQDESSSSESDSILNEDLVKQFTAMLEESSSYSDESSSLEESSSSFDSPTSLEESSSGLDESFSLEESSSGFNESSSLEESSSQADESSSHEESSSGFNESSSPEESSSWLDESSHPEESSSQADESSSHVESSSGHDESSSHEESSSGHDESSSPEESSSWLDESSHPEESSSQADESSSHVEFSSGHDESSSPEESSSWLDESSSHVESSSGFDESSSLEESSSYESSSFINDDSSEESSSLVCYLDKSKVQVHQPIVKIPVLLSLLKVDIDIYDSFNLFVPISSVIKVNWSINSLDCKVLLPTPNVFLKGELIADIEYVKDNGENTLHSLKIIVPYNKVIVAEWLHSPNLPSTHEAEYMFVSPDRQDVQYHREFTQRFAEPVYCELHGIHSIWHDELISKNGKPELDIQGKGTLTISLLQSQYVNLV